jgi:hypothetical protein
MPGTKGLFWRRLSGRLGLGFGRHLPRLRRKQKQTAMEALNLDIFAIIELL